MRVVTKETIVVAKQLEVETSLVFFRMRHVISVMPVDDLISTQTSCIKYTRQVDSRCTNQIKAQANARYNKNT